MYSPSLLESIWHCLWVCFTSYLVWRAVCLLSEVGIQQGYVTWGAWLAGCIQAKGCYYNSMSTSRDCTTFVLYRTLVRPLYEKSFVQGNLIGTLAYTLEGVILRSSMVIRWALLWGEAIVLENRKINACWNVPYAGMYFVWRWTADDN